MTVADFGSGSGAYVLAIAERLSNAGYVYAVDVQRDLLKKLHNDANRRGYTSVKVVWGDLELPGGSKLPDQSCDLVLISNLLFQVEDKQQLFFEAERILAPSGRLAVIDWTDSFGGMGPLRKDVVTKMRANEYAREAGFILIQEFPAGDHHYGLIFARAKKPS